MHGGEEASRKRQWRSVSVPKGRKSEKFPQKKSDGPVSSMYAYNFNLAGDIIHLTPFRQNKMSKGSKGEKAAMSEHLCTGWWSRWLLFAFWKHSQAHSTFHQQMAEEPSHQASIWRDTKMYPCKGDRTKEIGRDGGSPKQWYPSKLLYRTPRVTSSPFQRPFQKTQLDFSVPSGLKSKNVYI